MTVFKSLLAVRLRSLAGLYFGGKKQRKTVGILVTLLLVTLCFLALFAIQSTGVLYLCVAYDGLWLFPILFIAFGLLLSVFGSILAAKAELFEAKDNEALLAMPISPTQILLSRMVSLFLTSLYYTAMPMLPAGVVLAVFALFGGAPVSFFGCLFYFLLIPATALLGMTVSVFLGYVIAWISSRVRNQKILKAIFAVLFFIGAMLLYFVFVFSVAADEGNFDTIFATLTSLRKTPLYLIGATVSEGSFLAFLLSFTVMILPFFLVLLLLKKTGKTIFTATDATPHTAYKRRTLKQASPFVSFYKKELLSLISTPSYLMNGVAGGLLSIIFSILLIVAAPSVDEFMNNILADPSLGEMIGFFDGVDGFRLQFLLPVLSSFFVAYASMNSITASAISLEAKTFPLLKSMPISPSTVLIAKLLNGLTFTLPPLLVAMTVLSVVFRFSALATVLALLLAVCASVFYAAYGLFINLFLPKFDWENITAVVKNSASVAITVMTALLGGLLLTGITVAFAIFSLGIVAMVLQILLYLVLTLLLLRYFCHGGTRRFLKMTGSDE